MEDGVVCADEVIALVGAVQVGDDFGRVEQYDEVLGEIGVAVVVPSNANRPPTLEDLVAHGRSDLSSYKLPSAVRIVDRLPLNAGDKLDRRALAAEETGRQADG